MELSLFLLKDYHYSSNNSIPIILKITSNIEIKLFGKWDVTRVILYKNGEEVNGFGSTPALGIFNKGIWSISKDVPKYLVIDLNDYKNIMNPIVPDEYQIFIKILLYGAINDEHKIHKLDAQTNILLK